MEPEELSGTITMIAMANQAKGLNAAFDEYQKDHPNVNLDIVVANTVTDFETMMTTHIAANDTYSVTGAGKDSSSITAWPFQYIYQTISGESPILFQVANTVDAINDIAPDLDIISLLSYFTDDPADQTIIADLNI